MTTPYSAGPQQFIGPGLTPDAEGRITLWAHDDTVQPGKIYRYRMRVLIKNPLYQTPDRSLANAGVCARERGDDAAAAQYFERALSLQPAQPQALYNLAHIAFRRGRAAEAKEYVVRMRRAGMPLSAEALWLALRIERSLGDRDAEAR